MDDFDRLLEYHLRRKLGPIVAAPVPVRRGRAIRLKKDRPAEPAAKSLGVVPIDLRLDALVFVEHS
jgi:hypothetical protein